MSLQRTRHWATREFHDFLLSRARLPFAWGTNDCALFAADGILAMTGVDIASDFRGKYHDEVGAIAAVKSICDGASVADAAAWCAAKHGLAELAAPLMAERGDLVIAANGEGLLAGLVHLNGRHVVTVSEAGLVKLPIRSVKRAWSV